MTNKEIIKEFLRGGREYNAVNHLAYYGDALVNYSTVILTVDRENRFAKFNVRKYSSTTSRIQSLIRQELERADYTWEEYDGEPCRFWWNLGYQGAEPIRVRDVKRGLK